MLPHPPKKPPSPTSDVLRNRSRNFRHESLLLRDWSQNARQASVLLQEVTRFRWEASSTTIRDIVANTSKVKTLR